MSTIGRKFTLAMLTGSFGLLSGCAIGPNPNDPYESYNRSVYKFNHVFDCVVARPLADVYNTILPSPVQHGITNALYNFYEPSHVANDILQGSADAAIRDTARFVINTTIGIVGLFDVASHFGLPTHVQDLGITFARWGWRDSAYLIVPFFGIYTVRDAFAAPIDQLAFSFYPYIEPESLNWSIYAVDKIHYRAVLRPADKVIDESFDPYVFVRNAYFQARQQQINGDVSVAPTTNVEAKDVLAAEETEADTTKTKTSGKAKSAKANKKQNLPDIISQKHTKKSHV